MNVGIVIAIGLMQAVFSIFSALLGYLLGRIYTRDIKRPAPPTPPPKCLCGHVYGAHENGGYKCKVDVFNKYDDKIGACACRLYVGPDPLTSGLWHPPIIKDDDKGKK
jgi:hypothetical protein